MRVICCTQFFYLLGVAWQDYNLETLSPRYTRSDVENCIDQCPINSIPPRSFHVSLDTTRKSLHLSRHVHIVGIRRRRFFSIPRRASIDQLPLSFLLPSTANIFFLFSCNIGRHSCMIPGFPLRQYERRMFSGNFAFYRQSQFLKMSETRQWIFSCD